MSLASYRGRDVVLYFNEGVGCDACFYQMRQFEQNAAQLTKAGITILPIVMDPQDTGACTGGAGTRCRDDSVTAGGTTARSA